MHAGAGRTESGIFVPRDCLPRCQKSATLSWGRSRGSCRPGTMRPTLSLALLTLVTQQLLNPCVSAAVTARKEPQLLVVDLRTSALPSRIAVLTCVGLYNRDPSVAGAAYAITGYAALPPTLSMTASPKHVCACTSRLAKIIIVGFC